MPHFKHKKCRFKGKGRRNSTSFYRKRHGLKPIRYDFWLIDAEWKHFDMMGTGPRWHDILFHTRPRRRAEALCEYHVKRGIVDVDDMAWPLSRKPQVYYW